MEFSENFSVFFIFLFFRYIQRRERTRTHEYRSRTFEFRRIVLRTCVFLSMEKKTLGFFTPRVLYAECVIRCVGSRKLYGDVKALNRKWNQISA